MEMGDRTLCVHSRRWERGASVHEDCPGRGEWGQTVASPQCRVPALALSVVGRRVGRSHFFLSFFSTMHL